MIIERLNNLITTADVRKDVGTLIETRVACSGATLDHPTIQAGWNTDAAEEAREAPCVGVLGLINGLIGTITDIGPKLGWGYVSAEFGDDGVLVRFQRTDGKISSDGSLPCGCKPNGGGFDLRAGCIIHDRNS